MRPLRPSRPLRFHFSTAFAQEGQLPLHQTPAVIRHCSCSSPLAFSPTTSIQVHGDRGKTATHHTGTIPVHLDIPPDHRTIGTQQSLWTLHETTPGSPIFTPEGTYVFQKLQAFLRAQYPAFGFEEVVTPTIYKQSLWEQSGHWSNYKDDMFIVGSGKNKKVFEPPQFVGGRLQSAKPVKESKPDTTFGLKPMNCPGHCILFASKARSYHDLPIRYADFSPLHRDEVSGALSGLTRVRRFHQDDGHIFCRPKQVKDEIAKSIQFLETVYRVLGIDKYRLVLSTRPKENFIGTPEEWERAERQLVDGLRQGTVKSFECSHGDGAFYGPKIDAIIRDGSGKEHQIGTIQLDFQLPRRLDLSYVAVSPEKEEKGEEVDLIEDKDTKGPVVPVMIHRAVLGSLERFMAIFMEKNEGRWPFWLNPHQVVVMTVTDNPSVKRYAEGVVNELRNPKADFGLPRRLNLPHYKVDYDYRYETIAKKIAVAKEKGYAILVVLGEKNVKNDCVDVEISNIIDQKRVWTAIEKVKPGSRAPVQKDRGVGTHIRGFPGVRMTLMQLKRVMQIMTDQYI